MKTRVRLDMVGTAWNTTFVDTVHAGMQCADPLLQKPGVRGWNIERSVAGYDSHATFSATLENVVVASEHAQVSGVLCADRSADRSPWFC
eukprot:s4860_g10.t1